MPIFLKQSTASQEIPLGYFLDSTDGDTEETGLTIANTDIKLWKTGATTLANKNSGGGTHISNGIYYATLDATDTNTLGPMVIFVHVSGALAVRVECVVLAANVYDSLIAASDYLQIDVEQVDGDATAAANLNSACDNYSATRGLAGTALPAAAADAAGGLPISDAGGLDLDAMNTNIGSVLTDTNELQTDDVPGLIAALNDPTAAAIADAVWDEAAAGHVAAGSFGAQCGTDIDAILVDTAEIGAAGAGLTAVPYNAAWDADIQSECADALAAYDPPTKAELDSGLAALNDITAADVWDATSATLSLSFETIIDRLYRFLMNKMNITDASGAVAVRNEGDAADIATQTITDNDTTTTRTALSWV